MHAAAISPRGGVAPKTTCLRGQSIIEYVLIIAIIGLVIVFAGPGVAGSIRNQFNLVGNTVDSGTGGDSFMNAEDKAHQEAMKNIAAKDAKDWTIDELKAVSTDISKNGTSSVVYAKAKAALGSYLWSVKLNNGHSLGFCIVGINHDDLADGSGKAGLTFSTDLFEYRYGKVRMNPSGATGGWDKSELRQRLNSGDLWNLFPADFTKHIVTVKKPTVNTGDSEPTISLDKMFLPSRTELYGDVDSDGTQYEYYAKWGVSKNDCRKAFAGTQFFMRAEHPTYPGMFGCPWISDGSPDYNSQSEKLVANPYFCF